MPVNYSVNNTRFLLKWEITLQSTGNRTTQPAVYSDQNLSSLKIKHLGPYHQKI